MPLSSFFTHWNPMTSSKTQIKCQVTWESSNYVLTPIELMVSVFIGPSRVLKCPFSYPECYSSFIPQSSQFKSHYFFQPLNATTVLLTQLTQWNQSLGVNSTRLYPSTSKYTMSSLLSLPKSSVTFQILHLCSQLLSFPHLGFCHISLSYLWYPLFHCLLPVILHFDCFALVHFKQQCFSIFLPLFQTIATWLIVCFLFDEQMYENVSWYTWIDFCLFFNSMHSSFNFHCTTEMVLKSK